MSKPNIRKRRGSACPLCGADVVDTGTAPFCGQGCRDRDLLRWLSDGYRLPGPPADPDTDPDGRAITREGLDSEDGPPL